MPESKRRPQAEAKKAAVRRVEEHDRKESLAGAKMGQPNAPWFAPVMSGLIILGLLWVATYYISAGKFPVESWKNWNIAAGMGIMLAGFGMSTRWR